MTSTEFYQLLKNDFPFTVTSQQDVALQKLSNFILSTKDDQLFLLKGYAGTGKTSIIGTIVKNLWKIKMSPVLAAPTGRAAKVMSNYSGYQAQTIHRKIYYPKKSSGSKVQFVLQKNKHKDTIFIIDEASMISDYVGDASLFENGSLLDDLIDFVYSGRNCKLIFIGDTAQLPPVKLDLSPALDQDKLSLGYQKDVDHIELNEVVRQQQESGILYNATLIREAIKNQFFEDFKFQLDIGDDFVRLVDGYEIMDAINDSYSNGGYEETAIVVRSNKRANIYNEQIRSRILFQENEIATGDYLMVVKNNYFWVKPTSEAGFIANGDIVEILEIFEIVDLYGFRFAEVKVQMVDYPKMSPFETVIILDTLTVNAPSLTYEQSNELYQEIQKDYANETSKYKKFQKVKNNKYFNALQVKFSYAMTCHKSQGGQWDNVFVEQPYLKDGVTEDYLRWLYTACTRAKSKLYLIGFTDNFFNAEKL
ncbi:ATP-dependent DNA helicase [Mesonia aestuariivivens]|uniref:AAA family ATPase n=1 Tax=Mesonia aestuariivivens TaxID=2796128 RepID=A0ABS6VYH5_9FLAO|nr:AAA family ATPase [Mesonia aestuariivivens]MBW2960638.1 AAA family ATPase [Mesonia aestuariivivens]